MDILKEISDSVVNMDEEKIEELVVEATTIKRLKVEDIYVEGLNHGMQKALDLYENNQYDVPEIIVCADTLNKGINVLNKYGNITNNDKEKILLAVVEGDTHEIGKDILKIMLKAAGYKIIDMGVNQSVEDIIDMAIREKVDIIGLSSMMTTTRGEMKKLIGQINSMDLENKPYIILGGGSITSRYAREVKGDGYASNAPNAIRLVEKLIGGD